VVKIAKSKVKKKLMALQEDLQKLENETIAIWEYLTGKPSLPSQLERLYLKVLTYLVGFFLNARKAIAVTAKPGTIGGSAQAYREQVLLISADIVDAGITNPSGNNLTIHLLAKSGQPSTELLALVQTTMQSDSNRMVCDVITVQPATAQNYQINAELTLSITANEQTTIASATTALKAYTDGKQSTLGADIFRSDIVKILRNIPEIKNVLVIESTVDIIIPPQSYGFCSATVLSVVARV
jgi:phage-related baseplate assembly protein